MTRQEFKTLVGEAIGEASMAWSETPTGVFDSTRAVACLNRILDAADAWHSAGFEAGLERAAKIAQGMPGGRAVKSAARAILNSHPKGGA